MKKIFLVTALTVAFMWDSSMVHAQSAMCDPVSE